MEDYFYIDNWSYKNNENEKMIFNLDSRFFDKKFIEVSILEVINQFGNSEITEKFKYIVLKFQAIFLVQ